MRFLTLGEVLALHQITASVAEQERLMLDVATGAVDRPALAIWLTGHVERNH